jgi:hypothetical protein
MISPDDTLALTRERSFRLIRGSARLYVALVDTLFILVLQLITYLGSSCLV